MNPADTAPETSPPKAKATRREWNWHPQLPLQDTSLWAWPPRPAGIARYFARTWHPLTVKVLFVALAVIVWFYLQPALERCREFQVDWIAQMYGRNFAIMIVIAGSLHLWFYTFTKQGKKLKFDARDMVRNSKVYTWRSQVRDNMFWSLASGVTVWTAYEVLIMWAYANQLIPYLTWADNPVWFVAWLVLIPVWSAFHFYWVHRMLHWPPLYKMVHALHHRNVNVGPWSGLSMHPIEHVLYMSSVLIHWVVASHPIHVFFHMIWEAPGAAVTHTGFEGLDVKGKNRLALGSFYHQLHHRYFECNYGNDDMPWDKWFGTFHDGSPEAHARMQEHRRRMMGAG
jgi:sterol desaturase/sphingolipid hydroxylase (fatty acid hydroxylase superfamily)